MTGRHDYPELVALKPPAIVDPIVRMAIAAHPHNRSHRAKWIRAVRYLRKRRLWLRDGARATWGIPGNAA